MKEIRVRLTFIEEILGTASGNPALHTEFIASKAPDAETREQEIAAVGASLVTEKTMTVFPRNEDGDEILWPYQVKGFMKSAQQTLNRIEDKKSPLYLTAYKSKIDNLVFIKAVQDSWSGTGTGITIHYPDGVDESYDCERPLRAETAQGPRVALAHSETCPVGSWVEMDIKAKDNKLINNVTAWLDSGIDYGIGQWRNSGKGRFVWELLDGELTDAKGHKVSGNKEK